jgi:hypothetical protein
VADSYSATPSPCYTTIPDATVDLAEVTEAAERVRPYVTADGQRRWSMKLIERAIDPDATPWLGRRSGRPRTRQPWPAGATAGLPPGLHDRNTYLTRSALTRSAPTTAWCPSSAQTCSGSRGAPRRRPPTPARAGRT